MLRILITIDPHTLTQELISSMVSILNTINSHNKVEEIILVILDKDTQPQEEYLTEQLSNLNIKISRLVYESIDELSEIINKTRPSLILINPIDKYEKRIHISTELFRIGVYIHEKYRIPVIMIPPRTKISENKLKGSFALLEQINQQYNK